MCGLSISRSRILRAFDVTTEYPGATHADIRDVFSSLSQATTAHWEQCPTFDFRWLLSRARKQLAKTPATLLSFGAVYAGRFRGIHVVVVIRVVGKDVDVIDPLSRGTTTISLHRGQIVAPGPYAILQTESAALLQWSQT